MEGADVRRIIAAAIGGVVALAALAATLAAVNGSLGFASCSGTIGCGWIIPLLAAGIIGGVLLLLASQRPKSGEDPSAAEAVCPTCGAAVMSDWRLCPGCGGPLDT